MILRKTNIISIEANIYTQFSLYCLGVKVKISLNIYFIFNILRRLLKIKP